MEGSLAALYRDTLGIAKQQKIGIQIGDTTSGEPKPLVVAMAAEQETSYAEEMLSQWGEYASAENSRRDAVAVVSLDSSGRADVKVDQMLREKVHSLSSTIIGGMDARSLGNSDVKPRENPHENSWSRVAARLSQNPTANNTMQARARRVGCGHARRVTRRWQTG